MQLGQFLCELGLDINSLINWATKPYDSHSTLINYGANRVEIPLLDNAHKSVEYFLEFFSVNVPFLGASMEFVFLPFLAFSIDLMFPA
ncbi:MAG: hypothetical protein CM1200mP28_00640 [Deltaproteobacteria bacterium]|nr:MAG: hypothetical protein CM1200mP28_00640 [Deltaproteobacteria bacterium]